MRDDMPTLGRRKGRSAVWKVVVAVLLVAGGVVLLILRSGRTPAPPPPVAATQPDAARAADGASPASDGDGGTAEAAPSRASKEALERAGLKFVGVTVDGPLERVIVTEVGRDVGLPLVQVAVRALVWWVDVPAGLRRGDRVELLYQTREGQEPVVHAIRFQSGKTGQAHSAYRFKAGGDAWPRLWQKNGEDLEVRLTSGPLDDWEQVTSLLRDGRGHHGVDFRTPVGTPVKAPFDAVVVRRNWNFKSNGNSLELKESSEPRRTAIFLHLSKVADEAKPGERVAAGQVVAHSGNTGHSYAPHLHYELHASNGQVIDPWKSHATTRRKLADDQKSTFELEAKRLDELLDLGAKE
jgi:murein DD-endopeptidase MepM/ murein hydrolase activator NlpD